MGDYIMEAKLEGKDIVEAVRLHKKTMQTKVEIGPARNNIGTTTTSPTYRGPPLLQHAVSTTLAPVRFTTPNLPTRDFTTRATCHSSGSLNQWVGQQVMSSKRALCVPSFDAPTTINPTPSASGPRQGAIISSGPVFSIPHSTTRNLNS